MLESMKDNLRRNREEGLESSAYTLVDCFTFCSTSLASREVRNLQKFHSVNLPKQLQAAKLGDLQENELVVAKLETNLCDGC